MMMEIVVDYQCRKTFVLTALAKVNTYYRLKLLKEIDLTIFSRSI